MRSNEASSTKWYSRPSISPSRRGRVVYEIENVNRSSSARSRFTRVDFPVPDGAESTNRIPREASPNASLQVLDLLADLLGLRLQGQRAPGDLELPRLAVDRVRLAVDLLQQEVQ